MLKRLLCMLLALLTVLACPLLLGVQGLPLSAQAVEAEAPTQTEMPAEVQTQTETPAEAEPPAEAEAPAEAEVPAVPNQFEIYVGGQPVPGAHSILDRGTTYVSVNAVTQALFPETTLSWAGGSADVILTGPGFTLSYNAAHPYIVCNGRYLYLSTGVRLHPQDRELLIPVRVLAKALGAEVGWDASGVQLTPGTPLESGDTFYNAQDVDLLARVVQHESGNQPLAGKIGVANVILNRVAAGSRGGFANSVYGVLYQKNQFPGATNATPKSEAILAAKLALDGANTVGNAKWFNGVGKSCWASRNKALIINIGGHSFYG